MNAKDAPLNLTRLQQAAADPASVTEVTREGGPGWGYQVYSTYKGEGGFYARRDDFWDAHPNNFQWQGQYTTGPFRTRKRAQTAAFDLRAAYWRD